MIRFALCFTAFYLSIALHCFAIESPSTGNETDSMSTDASVSLISSLEASFQYEQGAIDLYDGLARLEVPAGYKFLNSEQSQYVLTELWGNPPDELTLGMLFPENISPISEDFTYAIEISYVEEGYIDDEDAASLDDEEILAQMQEEIEATNEQRISLGYTAVHLQGWATSPYYDAENKKLHWAKELHFEGDSVNTLNYNIRILGRNGYLMLNIIGNMTVLPQIEKDIDTILASVDFQDGYRYADFNPKLDRMAAYGIGSLIAGKMLAKAGFFAGIFKFWKLILAGFAGLFFFLKKTILGRSVTENE